MKQKRRISAGDMTQTGWSMIEMLGVLAVVGVLTIGGVGGFQKALSMYHEAVYKQRINGMMMAAVKFQQAYDPRREDSGKGLNAAILALNLVPDSMVDRSGMIYEPDTGALYTLNVYGSEMLMYVYLHYMKKSAAAQSYCRSVYETTKSYAGDIKKVLMYESDTKQVAAAQSTAVI